MFRSNIFLQLHLIYMLKGTTRNALIEFTENNDVRKANNSLTTQI